MIQYVFDKTIRVSDLEAELRSFSRVVAEEGYDAVSQLVIAVQPTLHGEPFELRGPGSNVPITRVIFESRLAEPKLEKMSSKCRGIRDPANT